MCPDPQILSVYLDGELPSPWKEKMETHLTECSGCKEKFDNLKRLQGLIKEPEHELVKASMEKVWKNLETKKRFRPERHAGSYFPQQRNSVWQRRISIPLPAAAAAAIIITLLAALWLRGGQVNNNEFAGGYPADSIERGNFILAAEEEMPGIIPAADMNSVLQYLGVTGTEIIILQLPESKSFSRAGEPAIIRAADYTRRQP